MYRRQNTGQQVVSYKTRFLVRISCVKKWMSSRLGQFIKEDRKDLYQAKDLYMHLRVHRSIQEELQDSSICLREKSNLQLQCPKE